MNKKELADKIRTADGFSDEEKSSLLNMLRTQKKYGLVWEDKPEDIEVRLEDELPVLTEVKDRAIVSDAPDSPNHVLIEGDNLEALTTLAYTHAGKIDVIYIDPPYNTGNKDFVYNDSYVDAEDGYRHSKWLSFMNKRLKIAKQLLADDGFICISIDDNEQSQLKILCDEIFNESNFINTVSVKAKSSAVASGGGEDKKLKKNIEYILIYAKSRGLCNLIFPKSKTPLYEYIQEKREAGVSWSYTNVMYKDGNLNYIGTTKAGNGEDIELYEVTDYVIKSVSEVAKLDNITEEEVYNRYIDKIFTTENAQTSIRTRVQNAVTGDGLYIARYAPVSGRNKGKITDVGFIGETKRLVSYLRNTCLVENNKVYKQEKIGTLWADLSWSSISREGGVAFPAGKKPIALIQRLISMHPRKNITVLDFFAGSGSTLHAVMNFNKENEAKSKGIIVTNNESKICDNITYPRLRNVIKGYGRIAGLSANSLHYYKTDFVSRDRTNKNMRLLVNKATDMLCIKNDVYKEALLCGKKLSKKIARYFEEGDKRMLVIYEEDYIDDLASMLMDAPTGKQKIKVYVFSPNEYAWDDQFIDVEDKVELCALPDAIYKAYRFVLPKRKVQLLADLAPEDRASAEADAYLEDYGLNNEEGGQA